MDWPLRVKVTFFNYPYHPLRMRALLAFYTPNIVESA